MTEGKTVFLIFLWLFAAMLLFMVIGLPFLEGISYAVLLCGTSLYLTKMILKA